MVERFRMHESKPVSTLTQCTNGVGSIMYGMVCGRLDLAYVVRVVSTYMTNLGHVHWEALKLVLRYLRRTISSSMCIECLPLIERL